MIRRLIPFLYAVSLAGPATADLLIGFEPGVSDVTRRDALRHYGLVEMPSGASASWTRVRTHSGIGTARLQRLMRSRGLARYVEPDGNCAVAALPNDPLFTSQWALRNTRFRTGAYGADIGAVAAWRRRAAGGPVIVAVVDTGLDYLHPDLRNAVWTNPGEIPGNGLDDDGNGYGDDVHGWNFYDNAADPMDITSHGTHCAGIIAAAGNNNTGVTGICPDVRIMALRAASPWETLPWSATAEAIRYAADNGARIINASWGGYGYSQTLADAIDYARQKEVLFVAAAGNYGLDNDVYPHYPASYPYANVISVAASDPYDRLTSWSNYGTRNTDLAAPGEAVMSTLAGGGYEAWGGTSMAAPCVCGAAALLIACAPALTPAETAQLIIGTTDPLRDTGGHPAGAHDGRLNAAAAMDAVPAASAVLPAPVAAYIKTMYAD